MLFRIHHLDPFRTVHRAVSRHFQDPRLVQLFDRYTTYNGSNPFRAPATLNVIPYVEYAFGGWYVRGGLYRIAEALAEVARRLGVEIHTSRPVEKILHDGRRVKGMQADGEKVAADFVLCGADVVDTWNHLIDGFPRRTEKLNRLEPSSSGMVFLWGVRGRHPPLAMHNILFSEDYRREFASLFDRLEPPDDPTVYIAITSRVDSDHAPEDGENWFVLLNMPHLAEGQNWQEAVDRTRRAVLARLGRAGIDVSGAIATEQVWTPEDFQRQYGSNRGSIYGISSNSRSAAFRRPPNRSRELEGLFFAGGSTHPGGGIPLVLLSGKMAADLIAEAADVDAVSVREAEGNE
jgi:phytoene desaturase